MPLHKKETKTLYQGKEAYVQVDLEKLSKTGEIELVGDPFVADASLTKVDRNGFEITYLAYLFDVFDQLGGQKYKVFKYIVEHKSSDNTLIITNRELAQKCDVSTKTVSDALRLLREKKLIATRTGAIMVLPKIAHRGKKGREQFLMHKFEEFSNEE
ncbi:MAG: replication/maintenance protein RepL [Oscillospiraceae bacterium]|nr:replication/maintenance protein RepL [Clostridia bacterium]MBQ5318871.1 replication/maintenance protein RepL [Oscillospiraceae bacterium]